MRFFVIAVCLLTVACGTAEVALAPTTTTTTDLPLATTTIITTTISATTTDTPEPRFTSSARAIGLDELGASWRDGCPVPFEELRWVEVAHWDSGGNTSTGVLVVHADQVNVVVSVFEQLFDARFPIESMRPISDFDGDDNASMRANNSSAFNCRVIGGTDRWSEHAYGRAIDINPLANPWVRGDQVEPPDGAAYVERDATVPGLIVAGDVVTEAFASIGWGWGGDWQNSLDYQHFSRDGG